MKPYWPFIIVCIAGFAAAAGTFWAAIQQVSTGEEMRKLALANAGLSQEIAKKSEQISHLTTEIMGTVTGGESFVYVQPLRHAGTVRYFLRQTGKYPTYDVVIRIQRLQNDSSTLVFGPVSVGTLRRGSGFDWTIPQPAEWPLVFAEPPSRGAPAQSFRVEISARNGVFAQRVHVRPADQHWITDSRHDDSGLIPLPDDFREAQEQG